MESTIVAPVASAKERLLASASRLFRERGINATGIDLVVREAGVAKASLYNNFASKEALVVAYLEQELDGWVRRVRALDDPSSPRRDRVAALFEEIVQAVESRTFYGCPFTNAVIELPECAAVRLVAERYRATVRTHLADITATDAASTAVSRLVLLYDAAITAAKVGRDAGLIREASTMAQELVPDTESGEGSPVAAEPGAPGRGLVSGETVYRTPGAQ
ncbi:TetR/AcrR family transcriptional regulator [Cryobacterium psychrophilum]|uniref:TetR/AcrR family transcriptional regulator n=1 Tax=Cryobacterium psychrophilum TaxID=41988 RepID=A0A4Y8KL19_9MICO|nr:TetR/AcrR family transcriptional regulator [Cryobacterium psychrophilum]TDW30315.1 TetR family transcriptional regulator [Cryobacterium psychrophilum]TFD77528.1 TetR/AcrR family transcriptional regulator [Cryobacterium psychrophilum]